MKIIVAIFICSFLQIVNGNQVQVQVSQQIENMLQTFINQVLANLQEKYVQHDQPSLWQIIFEFVFIFFLN